MMLFFHPEYDKHLCRLLQGAVLPKREVEDFEILHIDRKFFQGENAIRMVERLLNIDAGIHSSYKFGRNNHATWDKSNLGKRTRQDEGSTQDQSHARRRDDNRYD